MKPAFVRRAKPEDFPQVAEWTAKLAHRNCADAGVFAYPATTVLTAYSEEKNIVHVPVQQVPMLEALAINPAATVMEVAAALKALVQTTAWECDRLGMGEIFFMCSDEQTSAFAEHNGFEKVAFTMYRRRVGR